MQRAFGKQIRIISDVPESSAGAPAATSQELREDGSLELREDGSVELRE